MAIGPVLLEQWFREHYFTTDLDIGSSGMHPIAFAELRAATGLSYDDLDRTLLCDGDSYGSLALLDAIAVRWTGGDTRRVLTTHGSSEGIFLVMHGLLEPGDEVIVQEPVYQQHRAVAEHVGCTIKRWPLLFEQAYVADLDRLQALITPRTRLIVANVPHNPTGASMSPAEQHALIELAAARGCYLLWDAAFAELTYGAPPLPNPVMQYERCLSIGTLSKVFGLPGLRVGWCLGAPELLRRLVQVRDYVTLHLSPLIDLIATRAIAAADDLIPARLALAQRNLARLTDWMAAHAEHVRWVPPRGGVTVFPRLLEVGDVDALCRHLAYEHRVLLVPGSCFGEPAHVRLGFGAPTAIFEQGLARLSSVLVARRHAEAAAS